MEVLKKQILPKYEVDVCKEQRSGLLIMRLVPAKAGLCAASALMGFPALGARGDAL